MKFVTLKYKIRDDYGNETEHSLRGFLNQQYHDPFHSNMLCTFLKQEKLTNLFINDFVFLKYNGVIFYLKDYFRIRDDFFRLHFMQRTCLE